MGNMVVPQYLAFASQADHNYTAATATEIYHSNGNNGRKLTPVFPTFDVD